MNEMRVSKFIAYSQYFGLVLDTVHALEQLSITQRIDITAHAVCAACPDIKNKDIQCQSSPGLSVLMTLLSGLCSQSRFAQAVWPGSLPMCSCCCAQRGDKNVEFFMEKVQIRRANCH